jgi:hypothetical protein
MSVSERVRKALEPLSRLEPADDGFWLVTHCLYPSNGLVRVRATAVDAFSHNFRTIVVEDCVYDRAELSHQVGLFELNQKYADVLPSSSVIVKLSALT